MALDPAPLRASLWIKPTAAARERCRAACERARGRNGGPRIEPHVTLLGGIDCAPDAAERRLRQLAARLPPFELQLDGIGLGHTHFQRLFARIELSPALRDARRLAEEVFERAPAEFVPHLSLVYGDSELDAGATQGFEELAGLRFSVESLHLVTAARGVPIEQWRELLEATLRPESSAE